MRAWKEEIPTPPVEKLYQIVVEMSVEEAKALYNKLHEDGPGLAWRMHGGISPNRPHYKLMANLREAINETGWIHR